MENYFFTLGETIDDGSNFRVAEVLSLLDRHDYEEAYELLRGETLYPDTALEDNALFMA